MHYREPDCIVSYEGYEYAAAGAVVTPEHAIAYYSEAPGGPYITSWRGEVLGPARITARWATPRSWFSAEMFQVEAVIDGHLHRPHGRPRRHLARTPRPAPPAVAPPASGLT